VDRRSRRADRLDDARVADQHIRGPNRFVVHAPDVGTPRNPKLALQRERLPPAALIRCAFASPVRRARCHITDAPASASATAAASPSPAGARYNLQLFLPGFGIELPFIAIRAPFGTGRTIGQARLL